VNIYERTIALDESDTIEKKKIRIIIINHLLLIGEDKTWEKEKINTKRR
jgi:hypothetical protein